MWKVPSVAHAKPQRQVAPEPWPEDRITALSPKPLDTPGGNFVTLDSSVVAKRKLNRSAQERVFYFPVFLTPSESAAFPMERPSAAGGGEAGANSSKWGSQSSGPTP